MVDGAGRNTGSIAFSDAAIVFMKTFFKLLTLPIWLPFKILWFISKILAFIFLIVVIAILIYIAVHIL